MIRLLLCTVKFEVTFRNVTEVSQSSPLPMWLCQLLTDCILYAVLSEGSEMTGIQLSSLTCPLHTDIPFHSLIGLMILCTVREEICKSFPIFEEHCF